MVTEIFEINHPGQVISLIFFIRTREEIQDVRQTRDPILGFKEKLVAAGK